MELKIMTFNLRCACDEDGINHWNNRTGLVRSAIMDEAPDLIGFQEVTRKMLEDLRDMLSDLYVILGTGRERDYTGEGVNIAFRKDKFDLLSMETFWLSDTPNVPGSRYENMDQSCCPRITVIAGLAVRGQSKALCFCNTHLDHQGKLARLAGAKLIMEKLKKTCSPDDTVIITGDMNALPSSPVIPVFCDAELGVSEITPNLVTTFHKWGTRASENIKIDYIFTNAAKSTKPSYTVTAYQQNGIFCSDHYPVCGFVEV